MINQILPRTDPGNSSWEPWLKVLPHPTYALTEPVEQVDSGEDDEYPKAPGTRFGRGRILLRQER